LILLLLVTREDFLGRWGDIVIRQFKKCSLSMEIRRLCARGNGEVGRDFYIRSFVARAKSASQTKRWA
jgi:hypothetical protein